MFVRKRKNKTGTISVVVVLKQQGKFTEVKNFGTVASEAEADVLQKKAKRWIDEYGGQQLIDFDDRRGREREETERVVSNMDSLLINGTQLLLGRIYDSIGFNAIEDEVLRHLVIARLTQPRSKLATVDYLKSYYDEDVDLNRIYRFMDKLHSTQQELAQSISVEHTRSLFGGRLGLVFYDVTTLYFESAAEDELRSPGFSKDGKTAETQVVLGLLVSEGGYPLSYSVFNGKQYEGYTMIPMIDDFRQRYGLGDEFVVVADSGLMNGRNIALLRQAYSKGTLTKEQVNRRGYNKFLEISRDVTVEINESRIAEDAKWDGLKG